MVPGESGFPECCEKGLIGGCGVGGHFGDIFMPFGLEIGFEIADFGLEGALWGEDLGQFGGEFRFENIYEIGILGDGFQKLFAEFLVEFLFVGGLIGNLFAIYSDVNGF